MAGRPAILNVSLDRQVSALRTTILGNAGFRVTSLIGTEHLFDALKQQKYEVVILGHSLGEPECKRLAMRIRRMKKRPRLIAVVSRPFTKVEWADAVTEALGRPEDIIEAVENVLSSKRRAQQADAAGQ